MILTVLGCGTSTGVPLIGCDCTVCRSKNPKNHRTRASVWLQHKRRSILIDTSTDLRQQALRHKIRHVDFVLYTHPHADHVGGIDEMRSFNFLQKAQIPVYGNEWTTEELPSRFPYIFQPADTQEGGGIPRLTLNPIPPTAESLTIQGVPIDIIRTQHGSQECLGYRIDSVAYVTDTSYIPSESLERLKGLSVLVLDCLRLKPHGTHFHLDQALEVVSQVKPRKTYFTHLGHDFDYAKWTKKLPKGIALAYDGLRVKT
jgi:phosphoribosyl 1,2-cyclic phosphate phosphodiesterase